MWRRSFIEERARDHFHHHWRHCRAICGYRAFDWWWLAGRKSKRTLTLSSDGQIGNASVDEHAIERLAQRNRDQTRGF